MFRSESSGLRSCSEDGISGLGDVSEKLKGPSTGQGFGAEALRRGLVQEFRKTGSPTGGRLFRTSRKSTNHTMPNRLSLRSVLARASKPQARAVLRPLAEC